MMTCLSVDDQDLGQATEVARRLVGNVADVSRLASGGRNSRIWRVRTRDRVFALKQYPSRRDDSRDRLSTEVGALRLMERYGIEAVPRVVGINRDYGCALLSWIEGSEVIEVGDSDIDAAVAFLSAIHALRETPCAVQQPLAAQACLCGREIVRQIEERLARLRSLPGYEEELIDFINGYFNPAFSDALARAQAEIATAGLDFTAELPQECRSLVPSDFGFHNSLRRSDGSLAFVDFEYFGWDDPVKITADILLHPSRTLLPPQRKRFREATMRLYGDEPAFVRRLFAYQPLFGLRWVLILLNEFIPESWTRRKLAGVAGTWSEAKAHQLARAREFLACLAEKLED